MESALGIPVLRHASKKPAGRVDELEAQLGVKAHEMVMVGDRYLTDVLYGNRHGMATVRVAPLVLVGESLGVAAARAIENAVVRRCRAAGVQPPEQRLLAAGDQPLFKLVKNPGVW